MDKEEKIIAMLKTSSIKKRCEWIGNEAAHEIINNLNNGEYEGNKLHLIYIALIVFNMPARFVAQADPGCSVKDMAEKLDALKRAVTGMSPEVNEFIRQSIDA